LSVAYINTLINLVLMPNSVPDGSIAGTPVGALNIITSLLTQLAPPNMPANEKDNNLFKLEMNGSGGYLLKTNFVASYAAHPSYQINVHLMIGSADNVGMLAVFVLPPVMQPVSVSTMPSLNPSMYGQVVTFTASLTSGQPQVPVTSGTVTFLEGGTPLPGGNQLSLDSNGQVRFSIATLTAADSPHTITISYSGTASYSPTSSTATIKVNKAPLYVIADDKTKVYGQDNPPLTVHYSGFVLGEDIRVVMGSPDMSTSATKNSDVGSYDIVVMRGSLSAINYDIVPVNGTLTVRPVSTSTTLSASANPSVSGQIITFVATVIVQSPGSGTPTGNVLFVVDGLSNQTYSEPLTSAGTASFPTGFFPGTHTVRATYVGDTNFTGSSSMILTQTVNQGATNTTVSSSANPSLFGQSVTFTASVMVQVPGSVMPGGNVLFVIDGNTSQPYSEPLSIAGTATFPTYFFIGTHAVSATYVGDANFLGSAGSLVGGEMVNQASTRTSLSSAPSPSQEGQPVTFTALISVQFPGTTSVEPPSGMVTFFDGSSQLGQATVTTSGSVTTAIYSTAALPAGTHTITASYNGDGNFQGSSSDPLAQTVNASSSTIADGTILVCNSPLTGQSAPAGIIGIDPSSDGQSLIATGGTFMIPVTIREGPGPNHLLYVVDYSATGTGAVIVLDPSTAQPSMIYTGGNINGPVALAVDSANNLLYVLNVGGNAPSVVKIDLNNSGAQSLVAKYTGGIPMTAISLALDPTSGVLYLADEGAPVTSGPQLGTIYTVDLKTGDLNALPSPNNMLDHIEDLGLDANGHLLAFIAGSGSGGGVIQVDPSTGIQTALVTGLFSGTSLVLDGGTVDLNHGGTIYLSAYDPAGVLPSQLISVDPMSQAVSTVTMAGNLSLAGGLTVFSATGGGAAAAPSAHSGGPLHDGIAALDHPVQPDRSNSSTNATSLTSPPVPILPQLPGVRQPVAMALSAVNVRRTATDSVFADWDGGFAQQAFWADPFLSGMVPESSYF
jgi:hypothetical protein